MTDAPPLAEVEIARHRGRAGERRDRLRDRREHGAAARRTRPISPDTATCDECLAELFDPGDRRYRYPFINCTDCGPRFTIVRGVPYDRPLTTMAGFTMCEPAAAEYDDPANRRFHAQPNACPACGPDCGGSDPRCEPRRPHRGSRPPYARGGGAADGWDRGGQGIGGFHLACRAADERAVAALRARKHREDKPFALMARDLEAAR